jgi:hypothetical protein
MNAQSRALRLLRGREERQPAWMSFLAVHRLGLPGISDFHLVGYPDMRIGQMEARLFYIVQALVHVKVGLGIAPVQIESLERGPWPELRGQVPASIE